MEYILYGIIGYLVLGYVTFRCWTWLEPPIQVNESSDWLIWGDTTLTVAMWVCFLFWPIVAFIGGSVILGRHAIPKTRLKHSSDDSQDLLEADFTALETPFKASLRK